MCRYLLGLIGFAALGGSPLLAQTAVNVQTVTHREPLVECAGGSCPTTVCVPECVTKTVTRAVYNSGCEPLCVSYYPPFAGLFGLGSCNNGICRTPITRRYLLKKTIPSEVNVTKCVPAPAFGCATGSAPAGPVFAPPPMMPAGPPTVAVGTVSGFPAEPLVPQTVATPR